jgi:outer membrane lipoprotein SlyB
MKSDPDGTDIDPAATFAAAEIAKQMERTQIAKFHTKGGAGFAAEDANAFAEKLRLRKVEITGLCNELNGSDRIVDGVSIQTKYCNSARATVEAAFSENGIYRYYGQLLEVPRDQYEECLSILRQKITEGKVPNIVNPEDAERILKQGHITHKQACNIARAGNIDSLAYDAKTQGVTTTYLFAISFIVDFAQRRWTGQSTRAAINEAISSALASGSKSLVTGIAAAQLLRSRAAAVGTVLVRDGIKGVYSTSLGKTVIEKIAAASLGKSIYGAAALNHVSKLLRSNVVTSTIATVVITTPDFYRVAVARNISWGQFGKNLLINISGIAGGTGGWFAGAALGATLGSAVPVIGTAVGGFVGGILGALAGGIGTSALAKEGLDCLIEDDAKKMLALVQKAVEDVAHDYLLIEAEIMRLTDCVKRTVSAPWLKQMYQASAWSGKEKDSFEFAYQVFEQECQLILKERIQILVPPLEEVVTEMNTLLQTVQDQEERSRVGVEGTE